MLAKLKLECGEFCFWRKLLFQTLLSVPVAYVYLDYFLRDWPGASIGEYIVYSLTAENYFLVLFPFLCLAWTGRKHHEACRYPLLLRYRSRKEFLTAGFLARGLFLLAALTVHIGTLLVAGRSLPMTPQMAYASSGNLTGIIIKQLLNIYCYVCVMFLLHEILLNVSGFACLDIMLTAAVSLLNLWVVRLHLDSVIPWTPWGNIAYRLFEQEKISYRFYGLYWLPLILLLFFLADRLNGRKDYVFEETRKVD